MKQNLLHLIVMCTKYFIFIICLQVATLQLLLASNSLAQKINSVKEIPIKVNLEHSSLLEAFVEIEKQTNLKFSYDKEIFDKDISITFNKEAYVSDLLMEISKVAKLHFKQINSNIHVNKIKNRRKPDEAIEVIIDERIISGKVTSNNGDPLPGVNVIVKGTIIGTVTNKNGVYTLSVPEGNNTLIFSFIGFVTEEVNIGSQTVIDMVMTADIKTLSEIVVIGYGEQEKKDLTGSIASIKSDEIGSLPVPSISDAMQGKASGVRIISFGVPGSDATIRIRGTGTINNSSPLLVINGVPTRSGLNMLNPNDIKSIEILKDASATAIYGSRGANGVVIVTTKRGKEEENHFNIDVYRGLQTPVNTLDMLNAQQFAALHNEMMANNGLPKNPAFAEPASLGEGTDWLDELFHPTPMQSYSVSYSGNSETSNFYVSGNFFNQEGIVMETGYKRYTIQFNSDTELFDRLKFGNSLTLNHDVKTSGNYSIRNTMAALPTQPVFNPGGTYAGPTDQASWAGDVINPIGQARLVDNSTKGYNIIGSLYGELEIMDHLSFKSNAGLKASFWDSRTWAPKYDWEPIPEPDSYLYEQYNKSITWLWDNTLTYDKHITEKHHLTVLGGTSAQVNRYDFINGSVKQFASDKTQQLSNGTLPPTLGGSASEWALLSYFGRINYVYNDKYLVTATVRHDGSSRFGENNKWGVFPSGSLAWRISREGFFEGISFVNDLKLRVSYGRTGNQEIGNYPFASALQTIQYNFSGQLVPAVVPNIMPNPNVHWETVEQTNIGIDATLFDNRVNVTVDGYIKNTNDMLVPMSVPISTGYSDIAVPPVNAGKIQNKGIELSISTLNIDTEFKWNTDFNISYNKNEVISLNDTIPIPVGSIGFNYNLARLEAGHPINAFYGFVTDGLFQTQEQVEVHATQIDGADPYNRTSPGDIRFEDLNNDGVINDADRTYIGNPNPTVIFAMSNSFAYKGFDLNIFLQGVSGNEIFNANRIWNEGMAVAENQTTETLNRWTGPGTSPEMPRAVFNDPNKNSRVSDRYIEDGSYLRIKNITLGYTLPEKLTERAGMSSARIYASAQNLWTLTDYSGIDPEVPINGIDFNVYPVTRTISLGVNISF